MSPRIVFKGFPQPVSRSPCSMFGVFLKRVTVDLQLVPCCWNIGNKVPNQICRKRHIRFYKRLWPFFGVECYVSRILSALDLWENEWRQNFGRGSAISFFFFFKQRKENMWRRRSQVCGVYRASSVISPMGYLFERELNRRCDFEAWNSFPGLFRASRSRMRLSG